MTELWGRVEVGSQGKSNLYRVYISFPEGFHAAQQPSSGHVDFLSVYKGRDDGLLADSEI